MPGLLRIYELYIHTHSHGCVMCMYLVGLYSVSLLISKCKFLAKQSGLHSSKPDCVARKVTVCAALLSCSSASCACFLTNYCFLARPTMTTKSHWSTYWDNNFFHCLYSKIDQINALTRLYLTDSYIIFTLKMESVSRNTIFVLKMIVKSGLEKILLKFFHAGDYFSLLH